ncbi:MAG TPA: hypothetical protein VNQ74_14175, partial [Burkholderiaceae bacterium]|nr:hypothetical protein [Burkholderiaceae bacterium]
MALDRALWAWLAHRWRGWRSALHVVQPAKRTALSLSSMAVLRTFDMTIKHLQIWRVTFTWRPSHLAGRDEMARQITVGRAEWKGDTIAEGRESSLRADDPETHHSPTPESIAISNPRTRSERRRVGDDEDDSGG